MIVYWLLLLITAFFAYCIGSISTMRVASRFVFRRNLRRLGGESVWISNFRRLYGWQGFVKLLLVELVKDLLPILLGGLLLGFKGHAVTGRAFAGFCLLLGRLYPVFNRFRGGHGCVALAVAAFCVESSMGVMAALACVAALWFSRRPSLGAVAGALAMFITAILVVEQPVDMRLCLLTVLLLILRHLPSLVRLSQGREPPLSFREDLSYKLDDGF